MKLYIDKQRILWATQKIVRESLRDQPGMARHVINVIKASSFLETEYEWMKDAKFSEDINIAHKQFINSLTERIRLFVESNKRHFSSNPPFGA